MATAAKELEEEIMDVLSIGGDTADEPASNEPPAVGHQPAGAGDGAAAPSPSPEPTPAGNEAQPQPAAAEPAPAPASEEAPAPSPSPAPATPPAAVEPPPVDERALREASLAAQNDALRRELEALRANPQGQQGQQPPQPAVESGQPPVGEQPMRYGLTLPPELQDKLTSDDPAVMVQAINQIVNDLGTIVHNTVVAQLRKEMQQTLSVGQQNEEEQTRRAATEAARQQYYDAFPAHNNELILPIVQAERSDVSL